jgi:hypothetical protein
VLVVVTASRAFAVRIPESYKPPQDMKIRDWPFPQPYLGAAVRLDADRSQIVVERWRGAAVADVSVYGVTGGKLALLRFHPRRSQDQLSLFGTVGTGVSNARCVAGGPMVVITTWPKNPNGTLWSLRRSEYRLSGGGLWRMQTRTVDGTRHEIDTLAHRWGMDAAPFTGCVVARGRRL